MRLRRYWFKFDEKMSLGYGVTAWNEIDALAILSARVLGGDRPPGETMTSERGRPRPHSSCENRAC